MRRGDIKQIRKNVVMEGQYRFNIVTRQGEKPRIVADLLPEAGRGDGTPSRYKRQHVGFETTDSRLIQLANEILNHFDKKRKREEWHPTFDDFEIRLKEKYSQDEFYMWIIDYVRHPANIEVTKRIYSWLKMAAEMWGWEK